MKPFRPLLLARRFPARKLPGRRLAPALAVALLVLAAACSNAAPPELSPALTPPAASIDESGAESVVDKPVDRPAATDAGVAAPISTPFTTPFNPLIGRGEIDPILATKVLEVGTQRVAFLLVGKKALIKAPAATVTATYLGDNPAVGEDIEGIGEIGQATYHPWPYGIRGAYSAELTFDRPGPWRLDIAVNDGEITGSTSLELEVVEQSPVPGIGSRPPLSQTKTLADVATVEQLTTDYTPDEDLYRLSVAAAIESPRPAVVVFASPAFCTSPTCGPQVDTVTELKEAYRGRADFVHVEIYAFPEQIQGDLSRAGLTDAVSEWGFTALPDWFNESWVFVLNDQGIVEQRFEGFASLTELEAALRPALDDG